MEQYIVNLSTVYGGLPLVARPQAAADDGFALVESWWDFDSAMPDQAEIDAFLGALAAAQVQLRAINSYGGKREAGERGIACLPDRVDEFRQSIRSLSSVALSSGARKFNVTFGQLDPSRWTRDEQFECAAAQYRWAAEKVAEFGGTILVEALVADSSGDYPFHTGYDVVEFLDQFLPDVENIGLLFDTFHLAAAGVDVITAFRDLKRRVKHIQFADFPGRGRPGTGKLDFSGLIAAIHDSGYAGEISLEYFKD